MVFLITLEIFVFFVYRRIGIFLIYLKKGYLQLHLKKNKNIFLLIFEEKKSFLLILILSNARGETVFSNLKV